MNFGAVAKRSAGTALAGRGAPGGLDKAAGAAAPSLQRDHLMCAVTDFPLAWRWTSSTHASFSPAELAALHPCAPGAAARIHGDSLRFVDADGLASGGFESVVTHPATVSTAEGCAWLRARIPALTGRVTLSWQVEIALRTTWELFTARWDDFCYPSSDDVTVLPESGGWILLYHHWETFSFGRLKQ
jgi:hypothetical protein